MSDKELFKFLKTKEEFIEVDKQFSYFGWEGEQLLAFSSYIEGYKETTKLIYEEMKKGSNKGMDTLIYALCFNHRHCMEICLKKLYIKYSGKDEDGLKEFLNVNHNLLKIWEYLKPVLEENVGKVGSSVQINDIEGYIKEMDEFDKNSMRMRYPMTKKLEANNEKELRLDFHNFHECMLDFYKLIETIDFDIDNQVLYQATKEEYDDFLRKYERGKKSIKNYLTFLKPYVDKEIEKEEKYIIVISNVSRFYEDKFYMNRNIDNYKYLEKLSNDVRKIIIILYEAGKSVELQEIKLSRSLEYKVRDFINLCCLCSKKSIDFDDIQRICKKPTKNIKLYLEIALKILDNKTVFS